MTLPHPSPSPILADELAKEWRSSLSPPPLHPPDHADDERPGDAGCAPPPPA